MYAARQTCIVLLHTTIPPLLSLVSPIFLLFQHFYGCFSSSFCTHPKEINKETQTQTQNKTQQAKLSFKPNPQEKLSLSLSLSTSLLNQFYFFGYEI